MRDRNQDWISLFSRAREPTSRTFMVEARTGSSIKRFVISVPPHADAFELRLEACDLREPIGEIHVTELHLACAVGIGRKDRKQEEGKKEGQSFRCFHDHVSGVSSFTLTLHKIRVIAPCTTHQ